MSHPVLSYTLSIRPITNARRSEDGWDTRRRTCGDTTICIARELEAAIIAKFKSAPAAPLDVERRNRGTSRGLIVEISIKSNENGRGMCV
jgi:hypothetical protein